MKRFKLVHLYLHASDEATISHGHKLGLIGEAADRFNYACYEVKMSLVVDIETGESHIVAVDNHVLSILRDFGVCECCGALTEQSTMLRCPTHLSSGHQDS